MVTPFSFGLVKARFALALSWRGLHVGSCTRLGELRRIRRLIRQSEEAKGQFLAPLS